MGYPLIIEVVKLTLEQRRNVGKIKNFNCSSFWLTYRILIRIHHFRNLVPSSISLIICWKLLIPNLGSQSLKNYFSFSKGRGDTVIKSSDYRIRLSGILGKAQKPLFALVSLPNRVVIETGYCGNYKVL